MSDTEVEQKQVLQMLGEWGYTPTEFDRFIKNNKELARSAEDAVGMTVYSSLSALCAYAKSGDFGAAITDDDKNSMLTRRVLKMLDETDIEGLNVGEVIKLTRDDRFAEEVISHIYRICSEASDYHSAELALRENVLITVAPLLVRRINQEGESITKNIIEMLVGADNTAMIDGNNAGVAKIMRRHSQTLLDFIESISQHAEAFEKCKETPFEPFNEIMDDVIGDVDETIELAHMNILSVLDSTPEVWTAYAIALGRLMVSFMFAMSLGYVDYKEYENVVSKFHKSAKDTEKFVKSDRSEEQRILFGRN